jgi:hypothetical protein
MSVEPYFDNRVLIEKPHAQRLAAPDLPPCSGPRPRLAIPAARAYLRPMPRKPIELPPEAARRLLEDMRAYFAEETRQA